MILFMVASPTPYRDPFFELLSRKVDLEVLYLTGTSKSRPWEANQRTFKSKILKGVNAGIGKPFRLNWGYLMKIRDCDILVVGGYNHITTVSATFYGILFGKKVFLQVETWKKGRKYLSLVKDGYVKLIKSLGVRLLVTGKNSWNYWESKGWMPSGIFPNTPNIAFFRNSMIEVNKLKSRRRKILFVGRFIERKGLLCLIDVLKSSPDILESFDFTFVGSGPLRGEIEKLKKVEVITFKQGEQLREFYWSADIFLLPSLVEPWGVVVNEACAAGCMLLLSSQVGAAGDCIEGNGRIFKAGHHDSLLDALRWTRDLSDEELRTMQSNSLSISESLTYEVYARDLIKVLQ